MNSSQIIAARPIARSIRQSQRFYAILSFRFVGRGSLCVRGIALVLLALISSKDSSGASKDRKDDVFAFRLDRLRRTPNEDKGRALRDEVVAQYKVLIDEFKNDPRVAEAMLDVAGRLRNVWPEMKIFAKDAEALEWIRKAADTAAPGSKVWYKAQFWLVGEVCHFDTAEARRILQRISDQAKGHSLTLARVQDKLSDIAIRERDLDTAERHCRTVLRWYDDPKRIPSDHEEKRELDLLKIGTGGGLVNAFLTVQWPREKRAQRIRALIDDHPWVQALQREGYDALERLARPEYADENMLIPPAEKREDPGLASSPRRPLASLFAAAGGIAVILLAAGVWHVRRRRARSAPR